MAAALHALADDDIRAGLGGNDGVLEIVDLGDDLDAGLMEEIVILLGEVVLQQIQAVDVSGIRLALQDGGNADLKLRAGIEEEVRGKGLVGHLADDVHLRKNDLLGHKAAAQGAEAAGGGHSADQGAHARPGHCTLDNRILDSERVTNSVSHANCKLLSELNYDYSSGCTGYFSIGTSSVLRFISPSTFLTMIHFSQSLLSMSG